MGQRLNVDLNDSLFSGIVENKPVGVSGACYCCGLQLHIGYENLDQLPNVRIQGSLYQILICDTCEEDIAELEDDGIEDASYDVLFLLQADFQEAIEELADIHTVTPEDRFDLLKRLYIKHEKRLQKMKKG